MESLFSEGLAARFCVLVINAAVASSARDNICHSRRHRRSADYLLGDYLVSYVSGAGDVGEEFCVMSGPAGNAAPAHSFVQSLAALCFSGGNKCGA